MTGGAAPVFEALSWLLVQPHPPWQRRLLKTPVVSVVTGTNLALGERMLLTVLASASVAYAADPRQHHQGGCRIKVNSTFNDGLGLECHKMA